MPSVYHTSPFVRSILTLKDTDAFNTAFNFNSNMSHWYPPNTKPEVWWADWLPFLAHHRVPGDSIYLPKPRQVEE
jgi:hypothetical protein